MLLDIFEGMLACDGVVADMVIRELGLVSRLFLCAKGEYFSFTRDRFDLQGGARYWNNIISLAHPEQPTNGTIIDRKKTSPSTTT